MPVFDAFVIIASVSFLDKVCDLLPFASDLPPYRVHAGAIFENGFLRLCFQFSGQCDEIRFPAMAAQPGRADHLWEHTCFEIFLKPGKDTEYWELNFSPSGNWAAYRFRGYRLEKTNEVRIGPIEISSSRSVDNFDNREWAIVVNLKNIAEFYTTDRIAAGLTAVIENRTGEKKYWALAHKGEKPDFHLSDSFTYSLGANVTPQKEKS